MSEVIESFIRRHPGITEKEAFEGFLKEERIQAWVGQDEGRKERLRKEFGRTWGSIHADTTHGTARSGPSGPSMQAPRHVHVDAPVKHEETSTPVQVRAEPRPLAPLGTASSSVAAHTPAAGSFAVGGGRRLQVMCTACKRIEVWMGDDHHIVCRRCGTTYHDMLQLVRVQPVGPLAFYFGEGWKGPATAVGLLAGLVALYLLLRSV